MINSQLCGKRRHRFQHDDAREGQPEQERSRHRKPRPPPRLPWRGQQDRAFLTKGRGRTIRCMCRAGAHDRTSQPFALLTSLAGWTT